MTGLWNSRQVLKTDCRLAASDKLWYCRIQMEDGNVKELIFFKPYFKQVLWGGHRMRDVYGYTIPGDEIGRAHV